MKKLILTILILTIAFITNCKDNNVEPIITTQYIYVPTTPPTDTNTPPPPPLGQIDFFVYSQSNSNVYTVRDGIKFLFTNTHSSYAGNFRIAVSNVLYFFNENGDSTNSLWLPLVPDKIAIRGSDIYILKHIDPQTAYDNGALYKNYTEVFKNGVAVGNWYDNQYKVIDFFIHQDTIIIYQKDNYTYHDIENSVVYQNIKYATEDILVYNYDGMLNKANFKFSSYDYYWNWSFNYLGNSLDYQIANDHLYSVNGYRVKNDGSLLELENSLTNFNIPVSAEQQMVKKLCVRVENSEDVTYWLQCNSGQVYRHIPSIDNLSVITSFYTGNGSASTGLTIARNLNEHYINDCIYYFYNNVMWKYSFLDSQSVNFGGVCEVWE